MCWQVVKGCWFEPLDNVRGQLSGVLCNPPYIPSTTVPTLQVLSFLRTVQTLCICSAHTSGALTMQACWQVLEQDILPEMAGYFCPQPAYCRS